MSLKIIKVRYRSNFEIPKSHKINSPSAHKHHLVDRIKGKKTI